MSTILECFNIDKSYQIKSLLKKETTISLKNINFSVNKNEIFSIIGLNGAGKTTLLSIIAGILKPDSGRIEYKFSKEKIGYMPESIIFPLNLTPVDILNSMKYLFSNITNSKINETLNIVGLERSKNKPLKFFSKGMLQRFNLAQSIIHSPELLILDEPFSGLDPLGRILFQKIFFNLKKSNTTIIFSSHILFDVEKLSDKILILHKGEVASVLKKEKIKNNLSEFFFNVVNLEG